jgi:hypothetical protein
VIKISLSPTGFVPVGLCILKDKTGEEEWLCSLEPLPNFYTNFSASRLQKESVGDVTYK